MQEKPALEAVYESTSPEVDIIAVHGLGADIDWSWTWKDPETPDRHVKWLQDINMLPAVVPRSRILLFNYDSRWHTGLRLSFYGKELVHSIRNYREGTTAARPIVFIGHSLGGNIVQQALLYANAEDEFSHIVMSTAGVVFLGSPLRGSEFPFLSRLLSSLLHPDRTNNSGVPKLAYNDPTLLNRLHDFYRIRNTLSIPITCFIELYESEYGRQVPRRGAPKGIVVDEISACINGANRVSLQADHFKMNKYSGPDDHSFLSVSAELHRLCVDAPAVVRRRTQPIPVITVRYYLLAEKPEAGECLRDLCLADPYEDMRNSKRMKGSRAEGTCDWILGTDELTTWLGDTPEHTSPPTDILWLHGSPGTGKSIMSIFLAEELSEAFSKTPDKTIAYFFCDSSSDIHNTAAAIIRGLLLQLVQQHPRLIERILPKYEQRKARIFDSFVALWGMFSEACADTATGRKYCVVDALDECTQREQMKLLQQLNETFGRNRSGRRLNLS
ncbi:hypothetical protein ACHAQA_008254 [Verticillium albo-atrum]